MEKAKTDESKLWEVAVKYMQKLTDNPVERKNSRRSLLQHDRKIFESMVDGEQNNFKVGDLLFSCETIVKLFSCSQ